MASMELQGFRRQLLATLHEYEGYLKQVEGKLLIMRSRAEREPPATERIPGRRGRGQNTSVASAMSFISESRASVLGAAPRRR